MSETFFSYVLAFWPAGAASLLTAIAIVLTRDLHLGQTSRGHAGLEVQSAHIAPTPRIGGIALMVGALAAACLAPTDAAPLLWLVILTSVPVFGAGLLEDLNIGASPRTRLLAAAASSVLMILMSGKSMVLVFAIVTR